MENEYSKISNVNKKNMLQIMRDRRRRVSLKNLGKKVGKQALVAKALDRSVDQEESGLNLFDFSDDSSDEELQSRQISKKKLPKKKAPVKGNVRGAYYLANKDRIDKASLASQKRKRVLSNKQGMERMRFHKNTKSCGLHVNQTNCDLDERCNWSNKTKPNCKSKQKNVWKLREPKSTVASKVSLKHLGKKVGKQALVAKALDRSVDQEESGLNLFDFSDDSSDEELQSRQISKKKLPKKKAPVKGNVRGAYYLANKDRIDKASLASQKRKRVLSNKQGMERMRFHKNTKSCGLHVNQTNCDLDERCNWSNKTKPNCKSKQKNVWKLREPKSKVASKVTPKVSAKSVPNTKKCSKKQILNPVTNRCVNRDGVIGRQLLGLSSSNKPKLSAKRSNNSNSSKAIGTWVRASPNHKTFF